MGHVVKLIIPALSNYLSYLTEQAAKLTVQVGTGRNHFRREKATYLLILGVYNS